LVTVDWDAEPLPDLPFPNDLATRPDPTSPTGLRLNISMVADTHHQSEDREKLNKLTGWGIFQPITVGFRDLIDLDDFGARHALDRRPGDARLDDDAIFVIDVSPDSPTFGQAARSTSVRAASPWMSGVRIATSRMTLEWTSPPSSSTPSTRT
jgi:hypothetical protein